MKPTPHERCKWGYTRYACTSSSWSPNRKCSLSQVGGLLEKVIISPVIVKDTLASVPAPFRFPVRTRMQYLTAEAACSLISFVRGLFELILREVG